MNILFIKYFFVGFMVSEILRVSVFGHCLYSVTFPYKYFRQLAGNIYILKQFSIKLTKIVVGYPLNFRQLA